MNKGLFIFSALLFALPFYTWPQWNERLSSKVVLSINTNIETYFIAEKLAVEHIGNYVFSNKDVQFTNQPIVYFTLKEFMPWKNRNLNIYFTGKVPVIFRIFYPAQTR